MLPAFTAFTLVDALTHTGAWRIVYGIGCAFFFACLLVEARELVSRRRSGRTEGTVPDPERR
jgi:hypothetical protein